MYVTLVNGCKTGGAWEPYSTTKKIVLPEGDEIKAVHLKFKNKGGEESACLSRTITLDTQAPRMELPVTPATSAAFKPSSAASMTKRSRLARTE